MPQQKRRISGIDSFLVINGPLDGILKYISRPPTKHLMLAQYFFFYMKFLRNKVFLLYIPQIFDLYFIAYQ